MKNILVKDNPGISIINLVKSYGDAEIPNYLVNELLAILNNKYSDIKVKVK